MHSAFRRGGGAHTFGLGCIDVSPASTVLDGCTLGSRDGAQGHVRRKRGKTRLLQRALSTKAGLERPFIFFMC